MVHRAHCLPTVIPENSIRDGPDFLRSRRCEFNVDARLNRSLKMTLFHFLGTRRSVSKVIHALQSVSLAIHNGERVGLIGPNGPAKAPS